MARTTNTTERNTNKKPILSMMKKRGGIQINTGNQNNNNNPNSSEGSNGHSSSSLSPTPTKSSTAGRTNDGAVSIRGVTGSSSSSNTNNKHLPPRPPPPPVHHQQQQLQQPVLIFDASDPTTFEHPEHQQHEQPPSHLQYCGSSEDLSFADFSAMEDSLMDDSGYTNHNNSNNNNNPNNYNSANDSYRGSHNYTSEYHHRNSNDAFLNGSQSSSSSSPNGGNTANDNNINHQRRRSFQGSRKVSAVDVASVGNASDTMVAPQHNHHHGSHHSSSNHYHHKGNSNSLPNAAAMMVATRDLHERAKLAFNDEHYHEALPLFESILSAQVRRFSSTTVHPSVGAAMHNVGVCRQRLGQHEMAEQLFQEAVQIREQCFGTDHIEVAASLSKLGAAQTSLGQFEEAYDNLRKAVKIAISTLGHTHKTVAQMLCHLACLYFEAGELMSSEATFEDALDIYRGVWSTTVDRAACMTQLTDTLCNVGSIQNRRKRFQAACASFTEALDLQRGIVSPDDARIISTLDNLGYSYSKLKDYNGALQCYRKMYRAQISPTSSPNNSTGSNPVLYPPTAFESFRKQILMYEKLRRYSEAIEETRQALQLQQTTLPSDHEIIIHTEELLIDLQQKLRRVSES